MMSTTADQRFTLDPMGKFIKNKKKRFSETSYGQPLEFRPHSYFVDFTLYALFYIMTSLPAFVKVVKTPAIQNLALEQYAVKIGKSTL